MAARSRREVSACAHRAGHAEKFRTHWDILPSACRSLPAWACASQPIHTHEGPRSRPCMVACMDARVWTILLPFTRDRSLDVRVSVDGRLLLPQLSFRSPVDALDYLDAVLTDFRSGDQITLLALQAPPPYAHWTTSARSVAVQWCAMAIAAAWSEQTLRPPMRGQALV